MENTIPQRDITSLSVEAETGLNQVWRYKFQDNHENVSRRLDFHDAQHSGYDRKLEEAEGRLAVAESKVAKLEKDIQAEKEVHGRWADGFRSWATVTKVSHENFVRQLEAAEARIEALEKNRHANANQIFQEVMLVEQASQSNETTIVDESKPQIPTEKSLASRMVHAPESATVGQPTPQNENQSTTTNYSTRSVNPRPSTTIETGLSPARLRNPRPAKEPSSNSWPEPIICPSTQVLRAQGTAAITTYVARATDLANSIAAEEESSFISRFIKGLRSDDVRENLVKQLRRRHATRQQSDGRIEVMRCKWPAVLTAMREAGIIEEDM